MYSRINSRMICRRRPTTLGRHGEKAITEIGLHLDRHLNVFSHAAYDPEETEITRQFGEWTHVAWRHCEEPLRRSNPRRHFVALLGESGTVAFPAMGREFERHGLLRRKSSSQ
jgi:hypothetical protein